MKVFRAKKLDFLTLKIPALFLSIFLLPFNAPQAHALPQDATVISGDASFDRVNDSTLNITASANSIIEYSSFNIGAGETVNFFLPSTDSFSLNRVMGAGSSEILGNLFANGNLILVNSFGFNIGSTAQIDASGLILSTRGISNENFLAGNYAFTGNAGDPFSQIRNDGLIQSDDGKFAILIASSIENNGTVSAPLGTVALASGDAVTVGISQDGVVSVAIDQPVSGQVLDPQGNVVADQIKSTGTLEANGGRILLEARQAGNLFTQAINLDGHVQANHAEMHNGIVEITSNGPVTTHAEIAADDITFKTSGESTIGGSVKAQNNLKLLKDDAPAVYTNEGQAAIEAGGDLTIGDGVTVNADDSTYTVGGDWINQGVFNPGDSTVIFIDPLQGSSIYGDNTFNHFSVTAPAKRIYFEAGKTQTILGDWTTRGSYGNHVRLLSTESGEHWYVNSSGPRDLTYTWVEDSVNLGADEIIMTESTNRGNSIGWDPTGTWTNGGGNGLWSNTLNWSGLGGATPGAGDDLVFNGTSTANSFVDPIFLNSIGSLSVNAGYTGVITLQANLTITTASGRTGSLSLNAGTLDISNRTLTVHGDMTHITGTLTTPGGTVDFAGSGTQLFTHSTSSYYNITHSGAGNVLLSGPSSTLTVTNNFTNSAGQVHLLGHGLDFSGATFSNDGIMQAVGNETYTGVTQDTNSGTWRYVGDGDSNADAYALGSNFSGHYYNLSRAPTDSSDSFINGSAITANGAMTVSNGAYVLSSGATTTATGLTTVSGGTYNDTSGGTQTFNGGLTISGGTFSGGAGTVDVNGVLTLSSGTLNAPSGNLQVADDFTVSGTPAFNNNSGTVIFDSSTKSQAFTTGGISLYNMTVNNTNLPGVVTISGNLDINNNLTLTSGNLNLSTNDPNVNIAGNMTVADGAILNISSYTGTFTFDGTGTSTLTDNASGGTTFGSITVDGTSKTLQLSGSSPLLTFSTLTTGSDDVFSLNGAAVSISTLSNNGTVQLMGNESITLSANDVDSGTWRFLGDNDGAADTFNILSFTGTDYYNFTVQTTDANDVINAIGSLTIAGAFTLNSGQFSTGSLAANTITGLATINGGTYDALVNNGTHIFNGGLTVSGGTFTGGNATVDVNGNLAISSGTLTATSGTFTVSGDWTKSGGTFSEGTGTVTFDGSGTQTLNSGGITSSDNFYNITHSGSGTLRLSTNTLVVSNDFTNSGGTFDLNGVSWTMTGATFSNTATVQLQGSETITGLTQDTDSGTWSYTGDNDSAIDSFSIKDFGATDYYHLQIASSDASDSYVMGTGLNVAGNLTLSAGTLNTFANNLTVTGTAAMSGGVFQASSGTHTFNSGLTVSGNTFSGSTSDLDINGVFTLSSGSFTAPDSSGSFTVSDDFLFTGGTFTHGNGRVTLDTTAAATLNAPVAGVTFYDLEIASTAGKTVEFTGGDTFTVANASTFAVGNNATLTSTNTTAWNLSVNNAGGSTTGISFGTGVTISYANNVSTNTISATTVTDGGNNTGFSFTGGSGGGSSTGGTVGGGGGIDGGFNTGQGGGSTTGSGGGLESGGGESGGGTSGGGGGGGGNSGGENGSGGQNGGGPDGPKGDFDHFFENPRKSQTKVTVLEGLVLVLDRKHGKVKLVGKDKSTRVGMSSENEDFSGEFYANFRAPDRFKTEVKGQAYSIYYSEKSEFTVIFISEKTGPVALEYGQKPRFLRTEPKRS